MALWYLSFAAGGRCLGITVVAADDAKGAVKASWRLGLNPGGEIMIIRVPPDRETIPEIVSYLNRLVPAEEVLAGGGMTVGEARLRDLF
jgi:hypothetical protein